MAAGVRLSEGKKIKKIVLTNRNHQVQLITQQLYVDNELFHIKI